MAPRQRFLYLRHWVAKISVMYIAGAPPPAISQVIVDVLPWPSPQDGDCDLQWAKYFCTVCIEIGSCTLRVTWRRGWANQWSTNTLAAHLLAESPSRHEYLIAFLPVHPRHRGRTLFSSCSYPGMCEWSWRRLSCGWELVRGSWARDNRTAQTRIFLKCDALYWFRIWGTEWYHWSERRRKSPQKTSRFSARRWTLPDRSSCGRSNKLFDVYN